MRDTDMNASPVAQPQVRVRTITAGELDAKTGTLETHILEETGGEQLVWIDLVDPTSSMLATLQDVYTLHPLTMSELSRRHRVSEVSVFECTTHLVLQIPTLIDEMIGTHEVQVIIGDRFFISIHEPGVLDPDAVLDHWGATSAAWRSTSSSLLYACLRSAISAFGPVVEQLDATLNDLETQAIDPRNRGTPKRPVLYNLFTVTEQITDLYNVANPLKDVMLSVDHNSDWFSHEQGNAWSRDVIDDACRLASRLQLLQDTGQRLFDMVNSLITLQRADVADRLTLVATVFLPLAALGSFFGQNFQYLEDVMASREDFLIWGVAAPVVSLLIIFAVLQRLNDSP